MAAAKGNNYNPEGRPRKPIDWKTFEELCFLQCTQAEIAGVFHISIDTLYSRFKDNYKEDYSAVYKQFAEGGKTSLRRHQWLMSKKNAAMAIWLGKHWLGQVDTPKEQTVNEEILKQYLDVMNQLKQLQTEKAAAKNDQGFEIA